MASADTSTPVEATTSSLSSEHSQEVSTTTTSPISQSPLPPQDHNDKMNGDNMNGNNMNGLTKQSIIQNSTKDKTKNEQGNSGNFKMQIHPRATVRKRKRKFDNENSVPGERNDVFDNDDDDDDDEDHKSSSRKISLSSLGSSSSSSSSSGSDDDDDEKQNNDEPRASGVGTMTDSSSSSASSVKTTRTSNVSLNIRETTSNQNNNKGESSDDNYDENVDVVNNDNKVHEGHNRTDEQDIKGEKGDQEPQQQQQQQQQTHSQQPEGWRVKLYRLNADGSWDDCGTGRILCLYKAPTNSNVSTNASNTDTTNSGNNHNNCQNVSSSTLSGGDAWVYQELGEPTLCMHSEVSNSAVSPLHKQNQSTASNNSNDGSFSSPRILLRTRILLRDAYQRQGDNIITWCEPYLEEGNPAQGVDLALSFQDNAGCLDIWRQITHVQSRANEIFVKSRQKAGTAAVGDGVGSRNSANSVTDMAHAVAAAHHADLQRQDQQEIWVNVATEAASQQQQRHSHRHVSTHPTQGSINETGNGDENDQFDDTVGGASPTYHDGNSIGGASSSVTASNTPQLPTPPTLGKLEEIADTIAAVQHIYQQRENLAMYIAQNDCSYLKSLLSLFPSAEARGDYGSLATLAACVKTILLLNDPSIIELIVTDELIFEEVCSSLEYDPDLRDKANHRWFLRERAKFRTVAYMEDEELIAAIHRSFRVNYLRDTLLRPTMDESSLSTLTSLQTFTHADVVKGVTMSPAGTDDRGELLKDSYLAKVIRILGREFIAICNLEWQQLEALGSANVHSVLSKRSEEPDVDPSTVVSSGKYPQAQKMSTIWKQHLAPQDNSMPSRRLRRRGSLSFLRELFNMVRISLQQTDKDDFFAVLVSMEVDLSYGHESRFDGEETSTASSNTAIKKSAMNDQRGKNSQEVQGKFSDSSTESQLSEPVNLLSLLANVLSDPETDISEKGSVLEILSGIAMHDPSLIRRRCLEFHSSWKRDQTVGTSYSDHIRPFRPNPNEEKQVIFQCPSDDLLASLLFLLATEADAGVLLQASEIMRIILDTDMMGDHGPMNPGFSDESEGIPPSSGLNPPHDQHPNPTGSGNTTSTEQNQFLSMFYGKYVQWLAAPFQYAILYPLLRVPKAVQMGKSRSSLVDTMLQNFKKCSCYEEPLLHKVPFSALRSSFAVELLSFCVRAHVYRMKFFLLRSRVLGNVLKLLKPSSLPRNTSGDRCLKLAALRFLRAILSVNDEFYHRHIIQHDLFAPVFEAFRANPVGDNLVSSSIVEMCDYINTESINSLIEYIVTKHLSATGSESPLPRLEDVSSPYVSTLTCLRKAYEKLIHDKNGGCQRQSTDHKYEGDSESGGESHSRYFSDSSTGRLHVPTNKKALEDQRKYREVDQEESYFEADDDDGSPSAALPPVVDEVDAVQQETDRELHRTPRMFSLAQAPLLNTAQLREEPTKGAGNWPTSTTEDGSGVQK